MVFHAGLDTSASGLNVRAFLQSIGLAGLGDRDVAQPRGLAGCRELAEVFFEARLEPALSRLDLRAQLLDVRSACLAGRPLLSHRSGRRQQSADQSPTAKFDEAEGCFHHAPAIARRQQAKSWELRTAMSLAQLWWQQDKQQDARQELAETYGWFTEGFGTKDLREAKALLQALR
jgi:hypothetical protein